MYLRDVLGAVRIDDISYAPPIDDIGISLTMHTLGVCVAIGLPALGQKLMYQIHRSCSYAIRACQTQLIIEFGHTSRAQA